ncbi:MAG: DUF362 domain-containing protein [candidate division Zixibacteria bacterium]|nr:DUF362 domain-containing protein [candidate division Zixibacteria bacterium]
MRSGLNPKRMTYPCQQAALPLAANWVLAIIAFTGGSIFLKKFVKLTAAPILIVGLIWFVGSIPELSRGNVKSLSAPPTWEVENPVSIVCVMDSIPPTSGSLAPGDSTVPDEYLSDPAIDTLLTMLEIQDVYLLETAIHPNGIVDDDEVVIIKGNFQWTSRNTTSTDRIKGLIWRILQHPDGFTGEIIVCDNTQDIGTGINDGDNNSEDTMQSIVDVVNTFSDKGYPVYYQDWNFIWSVVASEYSEGDYNDGYIYEPATKVSYPKFQSNNNYISLRYGIWDSVSSTYDSTRLCIIDFPVLKSHSMAGATIALKNWVGVLTTAYPTERYGSWSDLHNEYLFSEYALVARVLEETYPELTIIDAAWTTTYGPNHLDWVEETKILMASTDPVASSWYAAKYILTPIARNPEDTNPDHHCRSYNTALNNWTNYLKDTAGIKCTIDSSEISVYDRSVLNELPVVSIDVIPNDLPVITPAGSLFTFMGSLVNNIDTQQDVDVAIYLILPGGNHYGPLQQFDNIPLAPYESSTYYNVIQEIPSYALPGNYTYIAYCGKYPHSPWDSSSFDFTITGGTAKWTGDWDIDGWFSDKGNQPETYELLVNYPNPFNSSTTISYRLSSPSKVKMEIYNLMGQKIETLIDERIEAGHHSVAWDASEYSSGIYFYRLTTGENSYYKRMVLLK